MFKTQSVKVLGGATHKAKGVFVSGKVHRLKGGARPLLRSLQILSAIGAVWGTVFWCRSGTASGCPFHTHTHTHTPNLLHAKHRCEMSPCLCRRPAGSLCKHGDPTVAYTSRRMTLLHHYPPGVFLLTRPPGLSVVQLTLLNFPGTSSHLVAPARGTVGCSATSHK